VGSMTEKWERKLNKLRDTRCFFHADDRMAAEKYGQMDTWSCHLQPATDYFLTFRPCLVHPKKITPYPIESLETCMEY